MTPAAIRKASSEELEARVKELFKGANERGGLTRKEWNEFHRIRAEQRRRTAPDPLDPRD